MNCATLADAVRNQAPSMFRCTEVGDDELLVSTPFTYPDGDTIRLTVLPGRDPGIFVVTDYGDAVSYLASHGVGLDASARRHSLVRSYLSAAGAAMHKDAVYAVTAVQDLPAKLLSISQCLVRLLELAHTTTTPAPVLFIDEVLNHVAQTQKIVVPKTRLRQLLPPRQPAPDFGVAVGASLTAVKTLSSSNPATLQNQVSLTIRLFDLVSRHRSAWRRVAVLDDTGDMWDPGWVEQMSHHCTVYRWNEQRDELDAALRNPA